MGHKECSVDAGLTDAYADTRIAGLLHTREELLLPKPDRHGTGDIQTIISDAVAQQQSDLEDIAEDMLSGKQGKIDFPTGSKELEEAAVALLTDEPTYADLFELNHLELYDFLATHNIISAPSSFAGAKGKQIDARDRDNLLSRYRGHGRKEPNLHTLHCDYPGCDRWSYDKVCCEPSFHSHASTDEDEGTLPPQSASSTASFSAPTTSETSQITMHLLWRGNCGNSEEPHAARCQARDILPKHSNRY